MFVATLYSIDIDAKFDMVIRPIRRERMYGFQPFFELRVSEIR